MKRPGAYGVRPFLSHSIIPAAQVTATYIRPAAKAVRADASMLFSA